VLGFRDLLLTTFPGTRNGHIGRPCELPGVSEHKEGRAYDWYVNAADPNERVAADTLLAWLLATDDQGNPFAMARRLGVMYVIWDGRIWSSFLADEGWRPYFGVQDHTDHVHFSFDWAGAMSQTTFWKGVSAPRAGSDIPDLPLIPVPVRPPGVPGLNTTVGGGGGSGPGASRAPAGPGAGSPSGPAASPSGGNPPAGAGGAPEDDPAPPPPRRSPPPPDPEPAPTTTSTTTTTTTTPQPVTVPTTPTTIRVGSAPF
jgi:hypothetical protein